MMDTSLVDQYMEKFVYGGSESRVVDWVDIQNIITATVLGFKEHKDIVGFASQNQLGGKSIEKGWCVKACVLDVSFTDSLVDLSIKQEFISKADEKGAAHLTPKKKRRREAFTNLQLHQTVNAIVEIVKENYLVLSIPDQNHAIGFASIIDYSTQKFPRAHFVNGQSVVASVAALPGPPTLGRFLLLLKSMSEVSEFSSKRTKKRSSYAVGSPIDAEITKIKPLEVHVKFGVGCHGRIHIAEVLDGQASSENPFSSLRVGQVLRLCTLAKLAKDASGINKYMWSSHICAVQSYFFPIS